MDQALGAFAYLGLFLAGCAVLYGLINSAGPAKIETTGSADTHSHHHH